MTSATSTFPAGTPPAEVSITTELVSRLLASQHPDLADLPLRIVASGWDNVMMRLGEEYAVRLPRRLAAASLIEHEQIWLPRIADRLPIPLPVPVRTGEPEGEYPWKWSILPWLRGETADGQKLLPSQSILFARFLRSLHSPPPEDAPINPVRGVRLEMRAEMVEERMRRLAGKSELITPELRAIWNQAVKAPIDIEPTWIHGDLHPRNILAVEGEISGIIDWGDIASGDPATDLASLWMLFDEPSMRREALSAYGMPSDETRLRAKGWVIAFGVVLLETGLADNPAYRVIGERGLRSVIEPG